MKKWGWLFLGVWMCSFMCVKIIYAQSQQTTITVTVAVTGTLGVTVTPTIVHLGTLNFGEVGTVSQGSVTVLAQNEGILQKYALHIGTITPPDWNPGTSTAGVNQFVLCALFNSTKPDIGTFTENIDPGTGDAIIDYQPGLPPPFNAPRLASATENGVFTGDQVGQNIYPGQTRDLWFRFRPPTVGVGSGVLHSIIVVITAMYQD